MYCVEYGVKVNVIVVFFKGLDCSKQLGVVDYYLLL